MIGHFTQIPQYIEKYRYVILNLACGQCLANLNVCLGKEQIFIYPEDGDAQSSSTSTSTSLSLSASGRHRSSVTSVLSPFRPCYDVHSAPYWGCHILHCSLRMTKKGAVVHISPQSPFWLSLALPPTASSRQSCWRRRPPPHQPNGRTVTCRQSSVSLCNTTAKCITCRHILLQTREELWTKYNDFNSKLWSQVLME